jgi:hypothetical protein
VGEVEVRGAVCMVVVRVQVAKCCGCGTDRANC